MQKRFPMGTRLSAEEAKACVDELYEAMLKRADEKVTNGRFMVQLQQGTLPREALDKFWLNWHGFVAEINNFIQCAYQRHLGFFKRHENLYAAFADKVADELIHPKAPGHMLVVWQQGEILGLTKEQMIEYEMEPGCRALIEWHRGLLHEGTLMEFWSSIAWEEYVGYWAGHFRNGLATFGYAAEQAPYFNTHEEADLMEHEDGVMGHGEFNRVVLQKLLEEGYMDMRPGFSLPYCVNTSIDLFAMFLDTALESAQVESESKAS